MKATGDVLPTYWADCVCDGNDNKILHHTFAKFTQTLTTEGGSMRGISCVYIQQRADLGRASNLGRAFHVYTYSSEGESRKDIKSRKGIRPRKGISCVYIQQRADLGRASNLGRAFHVYTYSRGRI